METRGRETVVKAAGLLMVTGVLSRILGYFRDILIAATYGQTGVTDAYQAAFSIPDFLHSLLVAGTVTAAFIPVFSGYIATDRREEGWEVASTVFNIAALVMFCGGAAAWIAAPAIVEMLVPGFAPAHMALTVTMTRIMLIQAFFMALNGICMGILNAHQRFLGPAMASVIYNVMIIFCGVLLGRRLGIVAFSVGVAAGAAAQFVIQVAALRRVGLRYTPVVRWRHPGVRTVFVLMVPVFLSYALTQAGLFVQQNISSTLPWGSLSALRTAQRLMQMPVSIFAITLVVAMFPTLNGQIARGETAAFRESFNFGLRSIFYITVPCAVGLAVLSRPIIRLLYQQGSFHAENTALTAYTLTFFCVGLFAQGGVQMMNRVFYAMKNTWTPVALGACAMGLNILMNYLFLGTLGTGGLALAYSLAGIVNLVLLLAAARRKIGAMGGGKLLRSFGQTLAASLALGAAAFAAAGISEAYLAGVGNKGGQILQVGLALAAGGAVFLGLSRLFKMEELDAMIGIVRKKRVYQKEKSVKDDESGENP